MTDLENQKVFISDIFANSESLFFELENVPLPDSLKLKPLDLFKMMNDIAKARFDHDFECDDFKNLSILHSSTNKFCILRELCKSIGVKIEAK